MRLIVTIELFFSVSIESRFTCTQEQLDIFYPCGWVQKYYDLFNEYTQSFSKAYETCIGESTTLPDFVVHKKTWDEARTHCRSLGADLISLDDEGDIEEVVFRHRKRDRKNEGHWIGARNTQADSPTAYNWLIDSSKSISLNNRFWKAGQPDPRAVNKCIEIDGGYYNPEDCGVKNHYICGMKYTDYQGDFALDLSPDSNLFSTGESINIVCRSRSKNQNVKLTMITKDGTKFNADAQKNHNFIKSEQLLIHSVNIADPKYEFLGPRCLAWYRIELHLKASSYLDGARLKCSVDDIKSVEKDISITGPWYLKTTFIVERLPQPVGGVLTFIGCDTMTAVCTGNIGKSGRLEFVVQDASGRQHKWTSASPSQREKLTDFLEVRDYSESSNSEGIRSAQLLLTLQVSKSMLASKMACISRDGSSHRRVELNGTLMSISGNHPPAISVYEYEDSAGNSRLNLTCKAGVGDSDSMTWELLDHNGKKYYWFFQKRGELIGGSYGSSWLRFIGNEFEEDKNCGNTVAASTVNILKRPKQKQGATFTCYSYNVWKDFQSHYSKEELKKSYDLFGGGCKDCGDGLSKELTAWMLYGPVILFVGFFLGILTLLLVRARCSSCSGSRESGSKDKGGRTNRDESSNQDSSESSDDDQSSAVASSLGQGQMETAERAEPVITRLPRQSTAMKRLRMGSQSLGSIMSNLFE